MESFNLRGVAICSHLYSFVQKSPGVMPWWLLSVNRAIFKQLRQTWWLGVLDWKHTASHAKVLQPLEPCSSNQKKNKIKRILSFCINSPTQKMVSSVFSTILLRGKSMQLCVNTKNKITCLADICEVFFLLWLRLALMFQCLQGAVLNVLCITGCV